MSTPTIHCKQGLTAIWWVQWALNDEYFRSVEDSLLNDCIRLSGLMIDAIIGIYPSERTQRQPIAVDISLFLSTRRAGLDVDLAASVDYARLVGEVRFLIESCRFHLLETAAEALCAYLAAPAPKNPKRAQVQEVEVRLSKPQALTNGVQPAVEVRRAAGVFDYHTRSTRFGTSTELFRSRDVTIHRLELEPGKALAPAELFASSSELVLSAGLHQGGLPASGAPPLRPGSAFTWAHAEGRTYFNATEESQTIVCVERAIILPEEASLHSLASQQSRPYLSHSLATSYYPQVSPAQPSSELT